MFFKQTNRRNASGPDCIIMGLSLTALGVMRSLGRKNVPIIGIDHSQGHIGALSKYCRAFSCPDPRSAEGDLILFLERLATRLGQKPMLFPINDSYVVFLSQNQSALSSKFRFKLPDIRLMEMLNDKRKLNLLAKRTGISVPTTYTPRSTAELHLLSREIRFPYILKPAYGYLFDQIRTKGIVVNNKTELVEAWNQLHSLGDQVVLQEFIRGKPRIAIFAGRISQ